jgi:hypothetical protein
MAVSEACSSFSFSFLFFLSSFHSEVGLSGHSF